MKRRSFVENSVPSTDNTEAQILTDCPTAITAVPSPTETGRVLYHIAVCIYVYIYMRRIIPFNNGITIQSKSCEIMLEYCYVLHQLFML